MQRRPPPKVAIATNASIALVETEAPELAEKHLRKDLAKNNGSAHIQAPKSV